MKFKVTMKDPDTLGDAITVAVRAEIAKIEGLDADDREALFDNRQEAGGLYEPNHDYDIINFVGEYIA